MTTRAPQPAALWLRLGASTCGTCDDGLLSTACISQSGVSGMRRPLIFDGLPEINSKLTHMKVLL